MAEQIYTKEGYQSLVDELDYLKNTKREEVKERLKEARGFGDLSENSEYDEAKNEQAKTEFRINELERLILNAKIIDESQVQAGVVNVGTTVKMYDFDFEEEVEYSLVGSNEADPANGKISDQSPIGRAIIGAKIGEEVTVETPKGEIKFKILEVSRTKA